MFGAEIRQGKKTIGDVIAEKPFQIMAAIFGGIAALIIIGAITWTLCASLLIRNSQEAFLNEIKNITPVKPVQFTPPHP